MEPLFRFSLLRPAVAQDPAAPSIPLEQESQFQDALADASTAEQAREAFTRAARGFVADVGFVGSPGEIAVSAELDALSARLDELERAQAVSHADLVTTISEAFGRPPDELAQDQDIAAAIRALRDSLVAIKLLPEEHARPIEALANKLRDLDLIAKTAADDDFPASPAALGRYRRRSLALPPGIRLDSVLSTPALDEERRERIAEAQAGRDERAEQLLDSYRRLTDAVGELAALGGDQFQASPQEPQDGSTPPDELRLSAFLSRRAAYHQQLAELNLKQIEAEIVPGEGERSGQPADGAGSTADLAGTILTAGPRLLPGAAAFQPVAMEDVGFLLKSGAVEALSETTKGVLEERGAVLAEQPLDRVVESLEDERSAMATELDELYGEELERTVKRLGDTLVTIATPLPSSWASVAVGGLLPSPIPHDPPEERIPRTHGEVTPAGIADLLGVPTTSLRGTTLSVSRRSVSACR